VSRIRSSANLRSQRGVGTLVVVMLLFFVVSLVAAYTNRNLIFEQKTSANQSRSTQAFEAADAGVEWALAQLNGGLMGDNCTSATLTQSFQQRYLSIAGNGNISQAARSTSTAGNLWPTCVFNGADWTCKCPADSGLDPSGPSGSGPFPAFRIWPAVPEATASTSSPWVAAAMPRAGLLPVISAGCTRLPASSNEKCLDYLPSGEMGDGLSSVRAVLALRSGLRVPPSAAVTVRGTVTPYSPSVAKLHVVNSDAISAGYTVNAGGAVTKTLFTAETLPGTPSEASFVDDDARLAALATTATGGLAAGERMFVSTFGMNRSAYKQQPGLRVCASTCTAAGINTLLTNNPNRIIWVDGNLTLDANIGDASGAPLKPVLLIVDGDTLTLGAGVSIYGFVYLTGGSSATSTIALPNSATSLRGALVAEGDLITQYSGAPSASSELTVTYDRAALEVLRSTYGSWVRLGGRWRDFKDDR
jgi:hypothetical protein